MLQVVLLHLCYNIKFIPNYVNYAGPTWTETIMPLRLSKLIKKQGFEVKTFLFYLKVKTEQKFSVLHNYIDKLRFFSQLFFYNTGSVLDPYLFGSSFLYFKFNKF